MPERALVVHARARQDVLEISTRIESNDPRAAERFEAAVSHEIDLIHRFPHAGRARRFRAAKLRGLRSRPLSKFSSWLVFYRVRPDCVEIARVIHGARDLRRALRS